MKRKFILALFAIIFIVTFSSFATSVETKVAPADGPAGASAVINPNNAAYTEFKEYDLNDKYEYTLSDGTKIVCPKNLNTIDGMVTTKNHGVHIDYDGNWRFTFEYTGLKQSMTKFYIRARNAAGVMIDLKEVYVYYESEYNERNGKTKTKAITDNYTYKILPGTAEVQVLGILDSY